MSAPLIVSIPHSLGREEATRRLKAGLTRAAASVPILQVDEERWEGNRLMFCVRARWGRQRPVIWMSRMTMPGWKSRYRGCCSVLPKQPRWRSGIVAVCC